MSFQPNRNLTCSSYATWFVLPRVCADSSFRILHFVGICVDVKILSLFHILGDKRSICQRSTPFLHPIVGIKYAADFFFDLALELLEVGEQFTALLHWEDQCVARVVVDVGDVITASSNRRLLSWFPYIQVYYLEEAFAYVALLWKGKSMFFAKLT